MRSAHRKTEAEKRDEWEESRAMAKYEGPSATLSNSASFTFLTLSGHAYSYTER